MFFSKSKIYQLIRHRIGARKGGKYSQGESPTDEESPDIVAPTPATSRSTNTMPPKLLIGSPQRDLSEMAQLESRLVTAIETHLAQPEERLQPFLDLLEKEKLDLLDIANQNQTRHYPLIHHVPGLMDRLKTLRKVSEGRQTQIVYLYTAIRDALWQSGLFDVIAPNNRSEDVKRVDQIKTLIDLYNAKISDIRSDKRLDELNQLDSIEYIKRLRERDVALLEGEA